MSEGFDKNHLKGTNLTVIDKYRLAFNICTIFNTVSTWHKGVCVCTEKFLFVRHSLWHTAHRQRRPEKKLCVKLKKVVLYSHYYGSSCTPSHNIKNAFKQLRWWKASRRLFTGYSLLTKSCKPHRKHTSGRFSRWKHISLCFLCKWTSASLPAWIIRENKKQRRWCFWKCLNLIKYVE